MPPYLVVFGAFVAGYAAYRAVRKFAADAIAQSLAARQPEPVPVRTLRRDPATGIYRPD